MMDHTTYSTICLLCTQLLTPPSVSCFAGAAWLYSSNSLMLICRSLLFQIPFLSDHACACEVSVPVGNVAVMYTNGVFMALHNDLNETLKNTGSSKWLI